MLLGALLENPAPRALRHGLERHVEPLGQLLTGSLNSDLGHTRRWQQVYPAIVLLSAYTVIAARLSVYP